MVNSPITATVPYDKDGVFHGFLRLPYSRDDSAWGAVMIPITVISNGEGPTALMTGGNHGDEYEGPIALQNLAADLKAEDVRGRVILLPFFNKPAFDAGTRTSPIDHGNMNRSFPGRPDGTVTEKIADYVNRVLVPMADLVVDFHSGGKTLDFLPFAAVHVLEDKTQEAACTAAMLAFGAPYSMKMLELDSNGMFDRAVEGQGKVFVTTELAGGGTSTAYSAGIALRGARNVLCHAGILAGTPAPAETVHLDMPDADCFVISEHLGLVEWVADLGAWLSCGDLLARLWPTGVSGSAPIKYYAGRDGLLTGRHFPGLVKPGDCLAVIAEQVDASGG